MRKIKQNLRYVTLVVVFSIASVNMPLSATKLISEEVGVAIANQTSHEVSGVVVDDQGEHLVGASVIEVGTQNVAITGADGRYTLKVSNPNATLRVTYIGFDNIEEKIKGRSTVDLIMNSSALGLDEIIVVGYGTQRKSSITGAISTINVDKMKDISTPSVANMLQGKVAGAVVTPLSGQPGAGVSIRIRGTGSIRASKEPLWVIDGVIGSSLADLNPNDVEAMSILKDGSATALYGSRGANGVILVTTKRGKMGDSQITVSARLGVSQLQKGKLKMMNGAEYYDYVKTAYENAGSGEQLWLQPYLAKQNTNWWDIATQNAFSQNYNIAYRYGNDKIRAYISGDYYNEEGTIKGFDLDRITVRANTDYVVNSRLTLKANLSASYRETYNQEHSLSYYSYSPWDSPYNSQGNLKTGKEGSPSSEDAPNADPRDYWYSDGSYNYLYDRHLNWSRGRTNAMDLGLGFDFKIFDFLTYESNNRFSFSNSYSESYTDPESLGGILEGKPSGKIYNSNTNRRYIFANQMLRLLKTFDDKHEINAFLAYEYNENRNWNGSGESTEMFPGNEVLTGGVNNHNVKGGKQEYKDAAILFNGNYAYEGKYLFQTSFRYDGSSRFGDNKRWAPFWSVGAGWNAHKEKFIQQFSFINELKPRISYGTTGNQPGDVNAWATTFDTTGEYAGKNTLFSNYSGNPDLSWEDTGSLDVGLDVRLFDRVGITFDYYAKKSKNMIYLEHLSAVTGFNRRTANDGKMENSGFEVTITPEIIKTKDIYWDISFNIGYNKNKITKLPQGDQLTTNAIAVGHPYLNWYMREWAGVDTMTGSPLWFAVDKETGQKTVTDDYNKATSVLLDATPSPKYSGGISTSFAWKGLSLNASFTFSAGAKIYNGQRAGSLDRDAERITQPPMRLADGWSRWEKPGDIATHPFLKMGGFSNGSAQSTRYLERGDYLKLKTLSLSYSLPRRWINPLGVKDLTISIGGENLFTITDYSGIDPEVLLSSKYTGSTTPDANTGQLYPSVKRFTMGLNLKF